jgi:hypothetical protein
MEELVGIGASAGHEEWEEEGLTGVVASAEGEGSKELAGRVTSVGTSAVVG